MTPERPPPSMYLSLLGALVLFGLSVISVWNREPEPVEAKVSSLVYLTQCNNLVGAVFLMDDGTTGGVAGISAEVVTRVINDMAPHVPPENRDWLELTPPKPFGCPDGTI